MLAARVSWVGPSFLSTIRQEMPCRLSSAAMNRPAGPAPTTNTWLSIAIKPARPARDRMRAPLLVLADWGRFHDAALRSARARPWKLLDVSAGGAPGRPGAA